MEALSIRDLAPLADLRELTNNAHLYTVHGLVMALPNNDADTIAAQVKGQANAKAAVEAKLKTMLATTPSSLRGYAQTVNDDWYAFVAADDASRAAAINHDTDGVAKNVTATKADWKLIDDMGVFAAKLVADGAEQRKQVNSLYVTSRTWTLVLLVIGLLLAVWLGLALSRGIRNRIYAVRVAVSALAQGDLTSELTVRGEDELGQMSADLRAGLGNVRQMIASVVESSSGMSVRVSDLATSTSSAASAAEDATRHAGTLARGAHEVSENVESLASNSEQVSSSISDISRHANKAAEVATHAVGIAESTNHIMAQLGDSSTEIGNVIKVITSIAEQTNLLALNATIEAARAGDAGKGFAVVASEVKELAQETAKATEGVSRRIQAIQSDTGGAVTAIAQIRDIVEQISDFQSTIAAAVEEQTSAAREMGRSVSVSAQGSAGIAGTAGAVSTAIQVSARQIEHSRQTAEKLADTTAELQQHVARFTV